MGWGLRGATEHCNLEVHHVDSGVFEDSHELSGYEWYGYDGFVDKNHRLTTTNSWVRDHKVSGHKPIFFFFIIYTDI